jgi:hypothetical protein
MVQSFSGSARGAQALFYAAMSARIVFAATCPQCKREQQQRDYRISDLMRLLYGGYPVEAYCVFCEDFWPVNVRKRVELGEMVAAACGVASPQAPSQSKLLTD